MYSESQSKVTPSPFKALDGFALNFFLYGIGSNDIVYYCLFLNSFRIRIEQKSISYLKNKCIVRFC